MLPIVLVAAMLEDFSKGSFLYSSCKTSVRIADIDHPPMGDLAKGAVCTAYIDGLADGLQMSGYSRICPGTASLLTIARVYVVYMDKNPKLFDEPKAIGMGRALLDAYPCTAK